MPIYRTSTVFAQCLIEFFALFNSKEVLQILQLNNIVENAAIQILKRLFLIIKSGVRRLGYSKEKMHLYICHFRK